MQELKGQRAISFLAILSVCKPNRPGNRVLVNEKEEGQSIVRMQRSRSRAGRFLKRRFVMKKNRNMKLAAGALLLAGMSVPAFGADAITFDPDGAGGTAPVANVVGFDWSPGNALSVQGNQAVWTYITSGTTVHTIFNTATNAVRVVSGPFGTTPGVLAGTEIVTNTSVVGGTVVPFSTFYQAKLTGLLLDGNSSPVAPAGLNTTYELTAVARFDEQVQSLSINPSTGATTVTFAHVPTPGEYIEIYYGDGANLDASDLAGTGFNNGTLILESDITSAFFTSNFQSTTAQGLLDQSSGDNYSGQLTVVGTGSVRFDGEVTAFDAAFFVDVLSTVGFTDSTNGNLKLPFAEVNPGGAFLTGSSGTAAGAVPVIAGAGPTGNPLLDIGVVNGGSFGIPGATGGSSIQFQADVNSSFERVPGVVPEPATAALGLMALAGLALRGRRNRA